MRRTFRVVFVGFAVAAFAAGSAWGVPVTLDEARTAVGNWVGGGAPLGCRLGRTVAGARTCTTPKGASFHVVRLAGGGFVVTSVDTACDPVVAFSPSGDLREDDARPLWTLLKGDADARAAALAARRAPRRTVRLGASASSAPASAAESKWAALLAPTPTAALKGRDSVPDVRVAPMLRTAWGQDTDYWDEEYCYNYYTPSHYPCGCTATAGAQVMRYFEWPKTAVPVFTCTTCRVSGSLRTLTTQGGVFDWANMPDSPSYGDRATDAQRKEIGRLTSDIGIICAMDYGQASGAGLYMLVEAFRQFGYSNAVAYHRKEGADLEQMRRALISNLDAGLPVMLSITGPLGGHAIVADGYGYSDSTLYCHFNMGWYGDDDAWYAPPIFECSEGDYFDGVNGFVYNVFTNQTAAAVVVSGRVLDAVGAPVAGAAVRVSKATTVFCRTQTDAKGIYSAVVPGGASYMVVATCGADAATTNVAPESCVTLPLASGESYGKYLVSPVPSVGNLSGVDLVLAPASDAPAADAPVPVPHAWLDAYYPSVGGRTAAAYDALALSPAANGLNTVWQTYLLGLDPTNEAASLKAQIRIVNDEPVVEWNVTNAEIESLGYRYRVVGVTNLSDGVWTLQTPGQRFFKVRVEPYP